MAEARPPVSKRLRYEILRRDNHTCRYCGEAAPDVVLTVDHVVPVALGGTNEPTNLVTACRDCNAGKTSTVPGAPLVDDVAQDAIRWAAAMALAADSMAAETLARDERAADFLAAWMTYYVAFNGGPKHLPANWPQNVEQFYAAGATHPMFDDAILITVGRCPEDPWRYFCGVMWRQIAELQDRARTILLTQNEAPDGP